MKKYNFDEIVDRKGTYCLKTDKLEEFFGRNDLIPLWIADMDFRAPEEVTQAIIERAKHGVFGYTSPSPAYYTSIIDWVGKHHAWTIEKEWISFIPGIVKGIAFAIDCFTQKGDKIIIQPPVYHPFRITATSHEREVVDNPLVLQAGQYKMDADHFIKIIDPACKMLILCNPHNPGGRVWTKEELEIIADICYDNNILVISDEIHSDFAFEENRHIPFASVSEKAAQNSITFMAPSKTFNIAGMVSSFAVIPNKQMREKFFKYLEKSGLAEGDIFAYLSAQTAYEKGEEWLSEVKKYLWENILFTENYFKENIPQIKAIIPQASFLVWLDCRDMNLSQEKLVSFFINDAKLALNDGCIFGKGGEGFMRMNIATPRSILSEALRNIKAALNK